MSEKIWWIIVGILSILIVIAIGATGYIFLNPVRKTPELPPLTDLEKNITPTKILPTPTWNPDLETTQFPQLPTTR